MQGSVNKLFLRNGGDLAGYGTSFLEPEICLLKQKLHVNNATFLNASIQTMKFLNFGYFAALSRNAQKDMNKRFCCVL